MPPTRGLLVPVGRKLEWYLTADSACTMTEKQSEERELDVCLRFKTCSKTDKSSPSLSLCIHFTWCDPCTDVAVWSRVCFWNFAKHTISQVLQHHWHFKPTCLILTELNEILNPATLITFSVKPINMLLHWSYHRLSNKMISDASWQKL